MWECVNINMCWQCFFFSPFFFSTWLSLMAIQTLHFGLQFCFLFCHHLVLLALPILSFSMPKTICSPSIGKTTPSLWKASVSVSVSVFFSVNELYREWVSLCKHGLQSKLHHRGWAVIVSELISAPFFKEFLTKCCCNGTVYCSAKLTFRSKPRRWIWALKGNSGIRSWTIMQDVNTREMSQTLWKLFKQCFLWYLRS